MNTIIIHHRSKHHAQHSGYDQLVDYVSSTEISGKQSVVPYKLAKYFSRSVSSVYGIYDSSSFYKDFKLFFKLFRYNSEKRVIHYLNAERDIRLAMLLKPFLKNTRICATFHKPPSVLIHEIQNFKVLKKLDGAIAVGENQLDFLQNHLGINHVAYIPHGVDTQFFIPSTTTQQNTKSILFVGQHLRDFDQFNAVINALETRKINVTVDVVLREDFRSKIKPSKLVAIHTQLTDNELLDIYQKATLLFLPLLDSTACNSILEAMACGLPIISSNVGGNSMYLEGTEAILLDLQSTAYILNKIDLIVNDEDLQKRMGDSVRKKALDYDWKVIAKQVEDFYKTAF